jgi:hypothetical protein
MQRFALGALARLYLNLVTGGTGHTGQAPHLALQRRQDSAWFNASAGLFQAGYVENAMVELNVPHLPGRYYFDFDHSKDLLVSRAFIVKMTNAGSLPVLAYDEIWFGPMPAVTAPQLCSIQGTLFDGERQPLAGALVQATLIPVFTDALGRGYQADAVLKTYSGADGAFGLPVVQGATIRFEIRAIGWDRRALVPSQPSVLFTAL